MAGSRLSVTIIAVTVLSVGCGVEGPTEIPYPHEDEGDGLPAPEDDGDVGQGAGSVGAGGPASGGAGAGGPSGSGGATGTSSSSSTGIGTASSGATTGGGVGGVCTPDGDDNACFVCAKEQCCPEVQACVAEPSCICWVQCMADSLGDLTLCASQCGLSGGAILDVLDCAGAGCSSACGL